MLNLGIRYMTTKDIHLIGLKKPFQLLRQYLLKVLITKKAFL